MRNVEMVQTEDGAPDGVNVTRFQAGQRYNMPEWLAERFIAMGAAKESKGQGPAKPQAETPEPPAGAQPGAETPEPPAPEAPANPQDGMETPGAGQGSAESDPEGPTDEDVAAAIRGLDPDNPEHWTNGGQPDVRAIADALNARVYADQRNRVWDAMQAGDL